MRGKRGNEMDETLVVEFSGPFSWSGEDGGAPSVFDSPMGRACGVYLWTVAHGDEEMIYYVGQTGREFATRMQEHVIEHCSGGYHLYSPEPFRHGIKECLWPGRYDPGRRTTIPEYLRRASDLWPSILALARFYRFFLAPVEGDERMRERIEGAIARHLYAQEGPVGEFQDRGIRYSPRRAEESPILVSVRCSRPLLGVPAELTV